MKTATTADSVYSAHKEKILGSIVGKYIKQLHDVAETVIPAEDDASLRCSTFDDLKYVCWHISATESIVKRRVYPALLLIGYNLIHHNNSENDDLLGELNDLVSNSILSLDTDRLDMLDMTTVDEDEDGASVFVCRMHKDVCKEIVECANNYNIRTSVFNMYYAMVGVRELIETAPEYAELKKSNIAKGVMTRLDRFEGMIKERIFNIEHNICGHNNIHNDDTIISYDEKFIQMNADVGSIGLDFLEYEYQMDIGRVDILCKSDDEFVLVEVKKGIVGTDVIGQLLKYVCTFDNPCRGMIIAEGFNKRVINAAKRLDIDLVKYHIELDDNMKRCVKISRL